MGIAILPARIGPRDHGKPMTLAAFDASDFQEGYKYELIDGRVDVTYLPELPEDWIENWLYPKLYTYAVKHPNIINYLTRKARVFIPGRKRVTVPEPDLAAYRSFPTHLAVSELRWRRVSPILVAGTVLKYHPDIADSKITRPAMADAELHKFAARLAHFLEVFVSGKDYSLILR